VFLIRLEMQNSDSFFHKSREWTKRERGTFINCKAMLGDEVTREDKPIRLMYKFLGDE